MPQPMRQTQRVPRTCTQCARRKIKCSKKIPCDECIRRGDTISCKREVVKVHGKVTVAVDEDAQNDDPEDGTSLLRENLSLKMRIRQLESVFSRPEMLKLETKVFRLSPAPERPHSSDKLLNDFQSLPFGLLVEASQVSGRVIHPRDDHLLPILPDQHWSETIVQFSLTHFGWVHCSLEASAFMNDHCSFWDRLNHSRAESPRNHAWIAVYLSVLAVGVYFLGEDESRQICFLQESLPVYSPYRTSLPRRVPTELCRTWCKAALKELNNANCLSKPSISTVQALAILNIVHKNLGESSREYSLHGLAVNVARLIGIDRLGEHHERLTGPFNDTGLIREHRNVYRRLWWTLVICDWMTVWTRPISIHPDSFTTVLETQDDIEMSPGLEGSASHVPSPFEYHKAMAQLAATMQNHARSINDWTMEAVYASFEELDSVVASFPSHLAYHGPDEPAPHIEEGSEWIHVQRYLIYNCLDSWRINLCVALIPQLLSNSTAGDTVHQNGILCAKAILSRRYHDPCPYFHKFWAVTCSTVTAAIFLALDMICFRHLRSSTEVAEEKELIMFSITLIELSSTETRHDALLVLRRLVNLYEILRPRPSIDQPVFARIIKLVASPRLWTSLSDAETTLRFLFMDTSETSKSPENEEQHLQTSNPHDLTCGDIPNSLSRFAVEAAEDEPRFEDLFSSDLIDMSLPWLDPATLITFPNEVTY
ncbi:hypothetical protein BO94DRAFT_486735 [Aspergillus sclerotioniger CBS 115572]|uniref:Zn(2)-C6 fungal-type domain-containing protein n=1 Tax=Aspergillus sclerotioniger CBS 115572 TaxID=1450535 RepID=A0A317X4M9_9EURO|nr:hypothetical protein BO94DRAFT_486735 [Aspergillus sclerotioniger CBS 115572]PWY93533.1 hypothetical protein BO94DRAFT_486735 [Aspergillus sclerotioniger CBS 115572]